MCLLCVFPPNVTPTREQLKNASFQNPHGFGYAFMTDDRILTGRGMDADEVIDRFMRLREGFPNAYAMFHARFTTHGSTTKANCHPFRVGGSPDIVLGHNGILPVDVPKGDDRSDTRLFADDILPDFLDWLDDDNGFAELEDWAGSSKVAIFSLDPRLEHNVYILNEQLGHWDNGAWWSNHAYKSKPYERTSLWGQFKNRGWWESDSSDYLTDRPSCSSGLPPSKADGAWKLNSVSQQCLFCSFNLDDAEWEYGYCSNCKSCLECAADILDCECERDFDYKPKYRHWWEEPAFANDSVTRSQSAWDQE